MYGCLLCAGREIFKYVVTLLYTIHITITDTQRREDFLQIFAIFAQLQNTDTRSE